MVRIAISQAAFDAIAKTLALGSVGYENKINGVLNDATQWGARRRTG
jgi:hypothetical protein